MTTRRRFFDLPDSPSQRGGFTPIGNGGNSAGV